MKTSRLIAIFILILSSLTIHSYGQDKGYCRLILKDSISNHVIPYVSIGIGQNYFVTANEQGYVDIPSTLFPCELNISHVNYGFTQKIISIPVTGSPIIIKLFVVDHILEEVEISTSRLSALSKGKPYSVIDYAFDKRSLWMIICENNNRNDTYLGLANQYGDTLCIKKVSPSCRLYKDVLKNVYIESQDSIYQLFADDKEKIHYLSGENSNTFHGMVDRYIAGFDENLLFASNNKSEESADIYLFNGIKKESYCLSTIKDSLERVRKYFDKISGSMWIDLKQSRYWMKGTKIANIYESGVSFAVFILKDTVFILNPINDSLNSYDANGKWLRSINVTFHKDTLLWGDQLKKQTFLVDDKSSTCYVCSWTDIYPLDIHTGRLGSRVQIPKYPGIFKTSIFNHAIYFLYQEKLYPYYIRLFRYQL